MREFQYTRLGQRLGWGGVESPFYISGEALRRHLYIVGKTGTGKTTLLKSILLQLADQGRGFALLDPHGDLAEEILDLLPRSQIGRTMYFNPTDLAFPTAWNILGFVEQDERPRTAAGIVSAFKNVWGESWGPRLEYILYNSLRALLDADHTTILGLPKLLSDPEYRAWIVNQVEDPFVRSFWQDEFAQYNDRFRQEAIAPIQNKIGALTTNPVLRNILGQEKRKLDIPHIMETGRILISNLSKGALGEEPSNLLGSLLVSEFQRAAMQRAMHDPSSRRDFCLLIDEFQNFTTGAFSSILSEARKYGLSVVLSHQFTSQLLPETRDAVFGNVGTTISFQLGASDAVIMAREYAERFPPNEFVHLERFHTLVKQSAIDGSDLPFRARTEDFSRSPTRSGQSVVRRSRDQYARPREIVEQKIARWMERWSR